MRRTLLALLLGLPATALGQSAGAITTDASTIDIAQCSRTSSTEVNLSDTMDMGLTWQVNPASSTTVFAPGGVFRVYAANQALAAGVSGGTTCVAQAGVTTTVAQVGGDISAPTQAISVPQTFSMQDIATAAGYGTCAVASAVQTIYLCVQWTGPANEVGWATGTVTLDLRQPAAPTSPSTSPGDGKLHVSCTSGTNDASFQARAVAGSETHFSSTGSSCSLDITGLTNGTAYTVVVFGISSANNPSVASSSTTGTPIPTDDFFAHYKKDGGPESGGCSTAAGAVGLLGGLSLLALRRRKP